MSLGFFSPPPDHRLNVVRRETERHKPHTWKPPNQEGGNKGGRWAKTRPVNGGVPATIFVNDYRDFLCVERVTGIEPALPAWEAGNVHWWHATFPHDLAKTTFREYAKNTPRMGGAKGGARDMSRKPKRTHRLRYGEGSFQWVESKQTWRGRIDAGFTPDGKRRRVEVTDRDEDKAWAKLIAKKKDLDDLTLDLSRSERTTVKQWLDIWLPERQRELSPGTFKTDNGYFRKWIIPTVGKKQLRDLGADDMRRIAARMRDSNRSTTTIKYVQRILQKSLRDAQAEGYRVPETILLAKKAKEAVSDRGAIPLNDIAKILEVLAGRPDKSRWLAALMQGMRQGECLGLTWDHVDLDAGTIDVSRQLIGIPYADKKLGTFNYPEGRTYVQVGGAQHLSEPKTVSSRRIIPLTDTMITALTEWQGIGPRSPHGLVWCRPGGMPLNRKQDAAEWALIQQQAGVWKAPGERYVLHEARNSTATLLLELGVDPEVIKAILGHSNIVTTRRYQRVSQELALRALRQVEAALQLET